MMLPLLVLFLFIKLSEGFCYQPKYRIEINKTDLNDFFNFHFSPERLKSHSIGSAFVSVARFKGEIPLFASGFGHTNFSNCSAPPSENTIYNLGDSTTLMNAVADPLIKFSLSTAVDDLFQSAEFKTRIHKFLVGNYTNYQGFPTYTNQSALKGLSLLRHRGGIDGAGTRGRFDKWQVRRTLDSYLSTFGPRRVRSENSISVFSREALALGAQLKITGLYPTTIDRTSLYDNYFYESIRNKLNLNSTYLMLNSTVLELPETHLFYNILTNSSAYVQSSSEEALKDFYSNSTMFAEQVYPGADMYSSAKDLLAFIQMHWNCGIDWKTNASIIPPEVIHQMKVSSVSSFSSMGFKTPLAYGTGSAIGWQLGQNGNTTYYEVNNFGGKVWRHKVRVFPSEDIIYIVMAFGVSTRAQKYLDSVHDKFVDRFFSQATCPDVNNLEEDSGCYVSQKSVLNSIKYRIDELVKYEGPYVSSEYSHTSWEKVIVYELISYSRSGFIRLTVDRERKLLVNSITNSCYIEIEPNLFYQARFLTRKRGVSECGWKYPMATEDLVTFLKDNEGAYTYMVFGKYGGLLPFERMGFDYYFQWDLVFLVSLVLFGTLFVITSFLSLFIFKCITCRCVSGYTYHRSQLAADTFIATVLALASHLLQSLCNCLALLGLRFFVKRGFLMINENYIIPVILTSLSLLGVVFWMLQVSTCLYLWISQSHRSSRTKECLFVPLTFNILITLSCILEILFVATLMNWNWLGPSHVI